MSLVWNAGKNLIVNGADIFEKIDAAMAAYKNGQFFEFGNELGQALTEVFLKAVESNDPPVKRMLDVIAYGFLNGFFTGISELNFSNQNIYNGIDGRGLAVWGPVARAMNTYSDNDGELDQRFWLQLHAIGQVFLEGGVIFLEKKIFDAAGLELVRSRFACIDPVNLTDKNIDAVRALFTRSSMGVLSQDDFAVGYYLSLVGAHLCSVNGNLPIQSAAFLQQ